MRSAIQPSVARFCAPRKPDSIYDSDNLEIIKAIRDRNPAAAERLARQHVRHALAMRLKLQRGRA